MQTVVHLASGRTADAAHALTTIENLLGDGTVDVEEAALVATADGVHALLAGANHADRVAYLADRDVTVAFVACRKSLAKRSIEAEDLHPAVERVATGVGDLIRRQSDGAAYVKIP